MEEPHVSFVSESNLRRAHDGALVDIDGYSLHTSCMMSSPEKEVSRIVAYIKDGIIVILIMRTLVPSGWK